MSMKSRNVLIIECRTKLKAAKQLVVKANRFIVSSLHSFFLTSVIAASFKQFQSVELYSLLVQVGTTSEKK